MAAATAADKSAMAAAAAGEEAAQLAVRRYVFEGMAPQHWPQAAAAPLQSGSKPCSKPRSRMPLVCLPSRQAARQVKPMPMQTLSSDAAFESALQPAMPQAKAPAIKRLPPPPPSCYHPHPAAADMAVQLTPALQPPRAPQQPLWVTVEDHVLPPVTVSLRETLQDQELPQVTVSLRVTPPDRVRPPATASVADGTPVPAQGRTGEACKTVMKFHGSPQPPPSSPPPPHWVLQLEAAHRALQPAPTRQPPVVSHQRLQVVQAVQVFQAFLREMQQPLAHGSPIAAGRIVTIEHGTAQPLQPAPQQHASADRSQLQQVPVETACRHCNVQLPLPPCTAPEHSWPADTFFFFMNDRFDKVVKANAEQATQRRLDRVSSGMRRHEEDTVPRPWPRR